MNAARCEFCMANLRGLRRFSRVGLRNPGRGMEA